MAALPQGSRECGLPMSLPVRTALGNPPKAALVIRRWRW